MALASTMKHEAETHGALGRVEVEGVKHVGRMEALMLGSPRKTPAVFETQRSVLSECRGA
jgi:hypothetical protein